MKLRLDDLDNRKAFINLLLIFIIIDSFPLAITIYWLAFGKYDPIIYLVIIAILIIIELFFIIIIFILVSTIKTDRQLDKEIAIKKLDIEFEKIKKGEK